MVSSTDSELLTAIRGLDTALTALACTALARVGLPTRGLEPSPHWLPPANVAASAVPVTAAAWTEPNELPSSSFWRRLGFGARAPRAPAAVAQGEGFLRACEFGAVSFLLFRYFRPMAAPAAPVVSSVRSGLRRLIGNPIGIEPPRHAQRHQSLGPVRFSREVHRCGALAGCQRSRCDGLLLHRLDVHERLWIYFWLPLTAPSLTHRCHVCRLLSLIAMICFEWLLGDCGPNVSGAGPVVSHLGEDVLQCLQ